MLDLLQFVQEDGQLPQEESDPGLQRGAPGLQKSASQDEASPHRSPSAYQPLRGTTSAPLQSPSKPAPKATGLMAKYKSLRNRRKSDPGDQVLSGRRSSSGAEDSGEYGPLAAGGHGEGRGENGAAVQHSERESDSGMAGQEEAHSNTFMGRMRAYRSKQRGGSKVGDSFESGGPLQQGMNGGGRPPDAAQRRQESLGGAQAHADSAGMKEFFAGVTEAKALLVEIKEQQRRISAARDAARVLVKPEELREAQQEVQDGIDEVTAICKRVKVKLDQLDLINADLLADDQEEEVGAEGDAVHPQLQMRLSVMAGLNARLSEVTMAWQQMRAEWHEEDQTEVARQLHTVTGREFPPEEVEELVQNGGSETIYRQALSNVSGATVRQLMSDVQERHDQIRQLETSMLQLHQVFLDMSILVADQGDTINSIDNWVSSTAATMHESLVQLRAAKAHRRKSAQTKAVTFVTGVGLVAGGAGLTATGVGAVAGIPMMVAGAAAIGGSAIGGIT